jgi:hypothetical protein
LRLEGSDIQQLLAQVREEYGAAARIVSADRVRNGGVAGFFSQQKYELTVEVDDPTSTGAVPVPAGARPGGPQSGVAQAAVAQPGVARPGGPQSGVARAGVAQSAVARPGVAQPVASRPAAGGAEPRGATTPAGPIGVADLLARADAQESRLRPAAPIGADATLRTGEVLRPAPAPTPPAPETRPGPGTRLRPETRPGPEAHSGPAARPRLDSAAGPEPTRPSLDSAAGSEPTRPAGATVTPIRSAGGTADGPSPAAASIAAALGITQDGITQDGITQDGITRDGITRDGIGPDPTGRPAAASIAAAFGIAPNDLNPGAAGVPGRTGTPSTVAGPTPPVGPTPPAGPTPATAQPLRAASPATAALTAIGTDTATRSAPPTEGASMSPSTTSPATTGGAQAPAGISFPAPTNGTDAAEDPFAAPSGIRFDASGATGSARAAASREPGPGPATVGEALASGAAPNSGEAFAEILAGLRDARLAPGAPAPDPEAPEFQAGLPRTPVAPSSSRVAAGRVEPATTAARPQPATTGPTPPGPDAPRGAAAMPLLPASDDRASPARPHFPGQPASTPATASRRRADFQPLRDALAELGLPAPLVGRVAGIDSYPAIVRALSGLPPAPEPPTRPGQILAVVGELAEALLVARQVSRVMRLDAAATLVAGANLPGLEVDGDRRLHGPGDAARWSRKLRGADTPSIVAVDAPVDGVSGAWARSVIEEIGSTTVWAVVDATRKPADTLRHLRGLGRVDGLAVRGTAATADPASVLELPVPVALLEDHAATPHAWAALLSQRLTDALVA